MLHILKKCICEIPETVRGHGGTGSWGGDGGWAGSDNRGAKRKSLASIGFSLSVNQFIPNCPGLYICGEVPLI